MCFGLRSLCSSVDQQNLKSSKMPQPEAVNLPRESNTAFIKE